MKPSDHPPIFLATWDDVPKVVNDIPMTQRVFSPETENAVNPGQVAYGQ